MTQSGTTSGWWTRRVATCSPSAGSRRTLHFLRGSISSILHQLTASTGQDQTHARSMSLSRCTWLTLVTWSTHQTYSMAWLTVQEHGRGHRVRAVLMLTCRDCCPRLAQMRRCLATSILHSPTRRRGHGCTSHGGCMGRCVWH